MSSEQISLVADHPFVRKFVFAILQNIRERNIVRDERYIVHADLVPKVSERVMKAAMERPRVLPKPVVPPMKPIIIPKKPVAMPPRPVIPLRPPFQRIMPQKNIPSQPQIAPPPVEKNVGLSQDYGKIMPLLNDPSVSTIECQGPGKALMVIRAGQRQITKIVLNANEIKDILDKVSDVVHIPILEGVFRAAVDNFSINAVVSEIIGSRFVIKKQNAYAMLE